MQTPDDVAARARGDGGNGEDQNGELRDDRDAAATAPKVAIERVVAGGHSEDGALVSLCVETGTQGKVTLVLEADKVNEVIDILAAELARAFKAAELTAGQPPKRMMFPVQCFAVGHVSGNPGVLLTMNQNYSSERNYLIANPQDAITLAQALTKQAAANQAGNPQTVIHNQRRLILPGGNGPN